MQDVATLCPEFFVEPSGGPVKEVEIVEPAFAIGRKDDNDLVSKTRPCPVAAPHWSRSTPSIFFAALGSTNGTFVNGQPIARRPLRNADIGSIRQHRLIFREESAVPAVAELSAVSASDRTMVIAGSIPPSHGLNTQKTGTIRVVSGRTNRKEYQLAKQLTIIGSRADATIELAGWLAPKTVAMIGRRGQGDDLATVDDGRRCWSPTRQ